MGKLYCVIFEAQRDAISRLCWGKGCGKGVVGAIDMGEFTAIPCRQESCLHAERTMEEPCGTLEHTGDKLYLRKLREEVPRG